MGNILCVYYLHAVLFLVYKPSVKQGKRVDTKSPYAFFQSSSEMGNCPCTDFSKGVWNLDFFIFLVHVFKIVKI